MATHRQRQLTAAGIPAGHLVSRLKKHADGEIELSPTQIRAAEILLDRALPKLSAVEQTTLDPSASLSEEQIIAQMTDIALKHPQVIRALMAKLGPSSADAAPQIAQSDAPKTDKAA